MVSDAAEEINDRDLKTERLDRTASPNVKGYLHRPR